MGGGGAGFAFTLYDDMNHGQSATTDTFNNPCLYNPDQQVDELIKVLAPVIEESENSTHTIQSISGSRIVESLDHSSLARHNANTSLQSTLLPESKVNSLSQNEQSIDQSRNISFRTDSVLSLKSQSPFKVSHVQVYGFSSEIKNRKKVPKISHKLFARPSDARPSDGR